MSDAITLDCGDSSCRYAKSRGGMRTNGGCRCDRCPWCGRYIRAAGHPHNKHLDWCPRPDWTAGMPVDTEEEEK